MRRKRKAKEIRFKGMKNKICLIKRETKIKRRQRENKGETQWMKEMKEITKQMLLKN
ncbi:MAG: hypothetical protein MJ252_22755 [archaeon]|nr:hypothetical protein [archaeon]